MPAAVRAELLDAVVTEARRLERMLSNLLQLTRVETGLVPHREWVPLDELVGTALARLETVLGSTAITVAVGELEIEVDPVLFELVLVNLIENAVKHGAPPIAITAARRGDRIAIEIADHGVGVAAADRERVFDKFYRASTAPGAGLGLAVVRAIVVAHGGTATVEGSRFTVELSAAVPA